MNPIITKQDLKNKFADFARNSERKLSIILGAGASYGYSRDRNFIYKPPTVSELLNNQNPLVSTIIEKPEHRAIKGQRAHIERSIKSLEGDLEAYLSDLYMNDTDDDLFPGMLRYLEDIFTLVSQQADLDDNYYQTLLNRTRDLRGRKPWSILTFNYETILEQSIANLQRWVPSRLFNTDTDYLGSNPKVLKMHGGVNFRYITVPPGEKVENITSHNVFTEMMNCTNPIEKYLELKSINSTVPSFKSHRILKDIGGTIVFNFPLMMIPMHTAVRNENSFFSRQIEQAKDEISQSGLVVAVGYQFGDNTFLDALKELDLKECTLVLVGTKRLVQESIESRAFKNASRVWPKDKIYIFDGDGFNEFADSLY